MKFAAIVRVRTPRSMIATALVAITCAASAATALASEPGQPLTKKVAYGDLNLDSEQGAKALYDRLRSAVREVCSPLESSEFARRRIWQVCLDQAMATTVGQVNRPMLTAVHNRSANRSSAG